MSIRHEDVIATGRLLLDLLTGDPRYRRVWRSRVNRLRSELSQAAVAEVIALHLWETGERDEGNPVLVRELKDRVSRALRGKSISAETLGWFIGAFEMDQGDASRLWSTFSGDRVSILGISNTLRRRREMIKRQCHRTLSLVERYVVGESGSLLTRKTHHTIRAIEDGVDMYIFNHEPQAVRVEVLHGGEVGRSYEYGGGLSSVEILLDEPLVNLQTTILEYRTDFDRESGEATEVRRAAFARAENIDLAVDFQTSRPPRAAWWCVWDDHFGGDLVSEERSASANVAFDDLFPTSKRP